jgi:hypothetical protein
MEGTEMQRLVENLNLLGINGIEICEVIGDIWDENPDIETIAALNDCIENYINEV